MKKARLKRVIILIAVATVAVVIAAAIVSVWELRPVVAYNITGYAYTPMIFDFNPYGAFYTTKMPNSYTIVNSRAPLMVALHWENKGDADASLQITLTAKNANITWFSNFGYDNVTAPVWASEADGQTHNGTIATFLSETEGHSTMQNKYFDIIPIGNPQNFTITYTIVDNANVFSSLYPSGKTTVTYELISERIYRLVN